MQTIVIPDVHENFDAVQRILEAQPDFDKAVFLGDWFDRFPHQPGDMLGTARWLAANQGNPNFIFLYGNHDMPYCYPQRGLMCSGHQPYVKATLLEAGVDMRKWFRFFAMVDGYLLSHAGITPEFVHRVLDHEALERAVLHQLKTESHDLPSLVRAGYARGGDQPKGGCTWLDWNDEFEDILGVPQIVGHTKAKEPRWKGASLCLDTMLKHYAVIEDGKVTVKETPL